MSKVASSKKRFARRTAVATFVIAAVATSAIAQTTLPQTGQAQVVEVCPKGDTRSSSRQGRLHNTIEQVRQYASKHPESFGMLSFGGPFNDSVVVSFTGDLGVHARALTALVEVPNGVVVCAAEETSAVQLRMINEVLNRANGAYVDVRPTPTTGRPWIRLRADQLALAAELAQRYGNRLIIGLGEFSFPNPKIPLPEPLAPCGTLPRPTSRALRWSIASPMRVHSGGDVRVKLSLRNTSNRSIPYESGDPILGVVTRVGEQQIVGRVTTLIAGWGIQGAIRPRQALRVSGLVSTSSCDSTVGYALPPGRYEVRFLFGSTREGVPPPMLSPAFPLTITNDPPPPPLPPGPSVAPVTLPGSPT